MNNKRDLINLANLFAFLIIMLTSGCASITQRKELSLLSYLHLNSHQKVLSPSLR